MQLIDFLPKTEHESFKRDLLNSLCQPGNNAQNVERLQHIVEDLPPANIYIAENIKSVPTYLSKGTIVLDCKNNRTYAILAEGLVEIGALG